MADECLKRMTDANSKLPVGQDGGLCVTAEFVAKLVAYEDTGLSPEQVERVTRERDAAVREFHKAQSRVYDLEDVCECIAKGDSPCNYCTLDCPRNAEECCDSFIAAFSKPLCAENGGEEDVT